MICNLLQYIYSLQHVHTIDCVDFDERFYHSLLFFGAKSLLLAVGRHTFAVFLCTE